MEFSIAFIKNPQKYFLLPKLITFESVQFKILMLYFITTPIGRLRLIAFLEGLSFIILLFIAVPLKYFFDLPASVKIVGQIHGILFLLFVYSAFSLSVSLKWKFTQTTWKVLLSSVIPFGTFYIDHKLLKHLKKD